MMRVEKCLPQGCQKIAYIDRLATMPMRPPIQTCVPHAASQVRVPTVLAEAHASNRRASNFPENGLTLQRAKIISVGQLIARQLRTT